MSPALCFRILEHLEELGLLRPGQVILDPLAGIGTTGLVAALKGYPSILVELEDKFVKLAQANADRIALKGFGAPITIIQGDARNLSQLLKERGLVAVSSPPYQTGTGEGKSLDPLQTNKGTVRGRGFTSRGPTYADDVGSTPGQIGLLPDKPIVGIVSPPYANDARLNRQMTDASIGDDSLAYGHSKGQIGRLPDKSIAITSPPYGIEAPNLNASELDGPIGNRSRERERRPPGDPLVAISSPHTYDKTGAGSAGKGYGATPGQIGNLPDKPIAITSPPYADQVIKDGQRLASNPDIHWREWERGRKYNEDNPANIGNLPDRPFTAITSPPYEDSDVDGARKAPEGYFDRVGGIGHSKTVDATSEGQIGQEQGQTYLGAMAQVYSELAKCCSVLVVVTKNPTRNGKLRDLCGDTKILLEATGWRVVCHHHAILFTEQEMGHLFEGQVKKPRGRLSFFKRLSYQKGSPVAMWEDVLVAVKGEGQGMCAVTSPPYNKEEHSRWRNREKWEHFNPKAGYGDAYGITPGQIGKLK